MASLPLRRPILPLLWPLVVLTVLVSSCAPTRPLPQGPSTQTTGRLDSLECLAHRSAADPMFGRFTRHLAFLDTLSCDRGLDLSWWDGDGASPVLSFPWKHGGVRNLHDLDGWALHFDVRRKRPGTSPPVLVAGWRDASGHTVSTHVQAAHVLDPALDTTWQHVNIPFTDFVRGAEATDLTRVEALEFSLESFGDVFIDHLRLGPSTPDKKALRRARKQRPLPCPRGKFILFDDQFDHVWGLGDHGDRRRMTVSGHRGRNRSNALVLEWDFTPEPFSTTSPFAGDSAIGFSWTGWAPVAIPGDLDRSKIEFHLKNVGVNPGPSGDLPLTVGIVDHQGRTSTVALTGSHFDSPQFGHWQRGRIPLSEFKWKQDKRDTSGLASIAAITLSAAGQGHVFLDDLQIVLSP